MLFLKSLWAIYYVRRWTSTVLTVTFSIVTVVAFCFWMTAKAGQSELAFSVFAISIFLVSHTIISSWLSGKQQFQIDSNDGVEKRRRKICDLIDSCESELLIVSGSFNPEIYDSPEVLASIERLDLGVRIEAYLENRAEDPLLSVEAAINRIKAKKFLDAIKDRAPIIGFVRGGTSHVIVVDRRNVRVEIEKTKPDDAKNRKALIFYHSIDLADAIGDMVARRVLNIEQRQAA